MVVKMLIVHLWVLSAAVQTTQASPGLSVSPNVTATCGQSVTLHCEVSSDQDDMIVKHLSWINNTTALCSVENDNLTDEHPTRDVECFYADKSLNVTFLQPSPQQSRVVDEYMCKLRSTHGFVTKRTWVQFKECIERVEATSIAEVRKCTFEGVLPDRELHWSNGHTRLTEKNPMFETRESVDKECCLTIISSLQPGGISSYKSIFGRTVDG
ncbi:unnamed protein product [Lota lota]